jgi:hypothetical protein
MCGPCIYELRNIYPTLLKQYSPEEIVFVFLCGSSSEPIWQEFISELPFSGEHYLMNREQQIVVRELLGVKGIPHHSIFDRNGHLAIAEASWPGRGLAEEVDKLLQLD